MWEAENKNECQALAISTSPQCQALAISFVSYHWLLAAYPSVKLCQLPLAVSCLPQCQLPLAVSCLPQYQLPLAVSCLPSAIIIPVSCGYICCLRVQVGRLTFEALWTPGHTVGESGCASTI